jgi:hypothetical protein
MKNSEGRTLTAKAVGNATSGRAYGAKFTPFDESSTDAPTRASGPSDRGRAIRAERFRKSIGPTLTRGVDLGHQSRLAVSTLIHVTLPVGAFLDRWATQNR